MLGRLIDQALPEQVDEPEEASVVRRLKQHSPDLRRYTHASPWGTSLPLLQAASLNLINLETAVTSSSARWPDKVFNYRMHPSNLQVLEAGNIHYVTLANNHTLDFSHPGLRDTVSHVRASGIAFAGAGHSRVEALRPATLPLGSRQLQIWAGSDHPGDWSAVSEFHLVDYSEQTKRRLRGLISAEPRDGGLRIFSIHWGPNYAWQPAREIIGMAHFLVDECGIDIIHGHSSHHVQGVELYHGSLIIYGCGDFVDDYALVPSHRNDLSAVWRVGVVEEPTRLRLSKLEVHPTRIEHFRSILLAKHDRDHVWVCEKIKALSNLLSPLLDIEVGEDGQLVFHL